MDTQLLVDAFEQYGYVALFLLFWIAVVWTPIPNEAVVMSGGFVSTLGILHPAPTFIVTYLGIVFGFTTGYVIGRFIGSPAMEHLSKKRNWGKYINRTQGLIERYGTVSLVISYLIPIVRIIVPYIVGINKMPYHKYALFSYTAGFFWTTFYFLIGRYFGNSFDISNQMLVEYSWIIAFIILLAIVLGKKRKQRIKTGKYSKDETKEIV